ncbi:A-kinase anchor protein 8-like [Corythoichthys intestinalis]|uniref:A-kinase anchor protein 8-like n=1 Tax=Corythoichthys intestinalis TaxID=161448 RepID=UPI0025A54D66|nr:A-kinase anchor protein 8-like [Corythoichthys intestinalis]XP_061792072.1 A-kinase anchor protein 8-like [Nerophis lumbriciformis]
MEGRNYGSGFSNWGGGGSGNRGSGNFDLFGGNYKNSMSGYGGYGGGNSKRGLSESSMLHEKITQADEVIAKINQRLDMLTQLEGGMKGGRGDRFDQFESFDSFSSSRDLFRSGGGSYGCDDGRGDNMLLGQRGGSGFGGGMGQGGGGGFNSLSSTYGIAKMRQNLRESFGSDSGRGGWAGRRSPRRGGGAGGRGFGGYRSDPMSLGGGGRGSGPSPGGRGKLPSLLSNRMYPEGGGFHPGPSQGPRDFSGRYFGGATRVSRARGRRKPLNKLPPKPQNDTQKKRKQMATPADEPESKMNKTENTNADAKVVEKDDSKATMTAAASADAQETTDGESGSAKKEESAEAAAVVAQDKQPTPRPPGKSSKAKKKRGFQERVMFACSICKFRTFYKEDMERHLESRFHKEHFKFLSGQLSKPTTDFLQEYLLNKFHKTDHMINQLENHSAAICQMYRDQDLTKDLGMEHFLKKVEAAHCSACDIFIPMEFHLIQKHIKSYDHNYNRKGMMEQSKRSSLSVARSILNHKVIGKKLESYLSGENPFVGNQEGQGAPESMLVEETEEQPAVTEDKEVTEDVEAVTKASEGEPAQEENTENEEVKEEAGMPEEQGNQNEEEGEEGFEVGEDEDEEGYVVHDEIDEEDGAEVCDAVVEEDDHKELLE